METVLFNIRTTDKETEHIKTAYKKAKHRARAYRNRWCVSLIIMAALSFVIGILLGHIKTMSDKDAIITQTETVAPVVYTVAAEVEDEAVPTEPPAFFALTTEQRTLIEQVVSAEARGEPYDGQMAVSQCILNACLKNDITPERAIKKYAYTGAREEPTASVKKAVAAVFDRGEIVTEEPILYFYAPARVKSDFHESQIFVIEIQNHRFFKELEK